MADSPSRFASARIRAVLLLLLGGAQMAGAALAFYLILETGVNRVSVATMTATSLLTVVSLYLRRRHRLW